MRDLIDKEHGLETACTCLWEEILIMLQTGIEDWPKLNAAELLQIREGARVPTAQSNKRLGGRRS